MISVALLHGVTAEQITTGLGPERAMDSSAKPSDKD